MPRLLLRFGAGVSAPDPFLFAEPGAAQEANGLREFKWIHVATEGTYKGHQQGEFTLDKRAFDQMIANLRADPRFKRDPATGLGNAKVIPYDYEHASELDPTMGTVPLTGAGAPAWCMDLEVRKGGDGKHQLWAWTKLGKNIQRQLANEEYAFTSIAFTADATDPYSGKPVGHRISSIAFTNTPFIRELEAIAASARMPPARSAGTMSAMVIKVTARDRGRNDTERLLSALRRSDPRFARRSWVDQISHVHHLRRNGAKIVGLAEPAAADSDRAELEPATLAILQALGVEDPSALGPEELKPIREQLEKALEDVRAMNHSAYVPAGAAPAPGATKTPATPPAALSSRVIEVLTTDTGRNPTERLLSALRRQDPSFKRRSFQDQLSQVHQLRCGGAKIVER